MEEDDEIVIVSKDLAVGYGYSLYLTVAQAKQLLDDKIGDVIDLESSGASIEIRKHTIVARQGGHGGTSSLDKEDVFEKLERALGILEED